MRYICPRALESVRPSMGPPRGRPNHQPSHCPVQGISCEQYKRSEQATRSGSTLGFFEGLSSGGHRPMTTQIGRRPNTALVTDPNATRRSEDQARLLTPNNAESPETSLESLLCKPGKVHNENDRGIQHNAKDVRLPNRGNQVSNMLEQTFRSEPTTEEVCLVSPMLSQGPRK